MKQIAQTALDKYSFFFNSALKNKTQQVKLETVAKLIEQITKAKTEELK